MIKKKTFQQKENTFFVEIKQINSSEEQKRLFLLIGDIARYIFKKSEIQSEIEIIFKDENAEEYNLNDFVFWDKLFENPDIAKYASSLANELFNIYYKGGLNFTSTKGYNFCEVLFFRAALKNADLISNYLNLFIIWDKNCDSHLNKELLQIIEKHGWNKKIESVLVSRYLHFVDESFFKDFELLLQENIPGFHKSSFFKSIVFDSYRDAADFSEWNKKMSLTMPLNHYEKAVSFIKNDLTIGAFGMEPDKKVFIKRELYNYFMVGIKDLEDQNQFEIYWTEILEQDEHPIVLCKIHDNKIVVVNWNAWLRIYDINTKELVYDKKFGGHIDSSAVILEDYNAVAIGYSHDKYKSDYLDVISLDNFEPVYHWNLPRFFCSSKMQLASYDRIFFYYNDEDLATEEYTHGYNIVHIKTGETESVTMPNSALDDIDSTLPFLNIEKNIGIMPSWNDLEFVKNSENDYCIPFEVRVFELDDLEQTKSVFKVVNFPIKALKSFDSDLKELEKRIEENDFDDDYLKELKQDLYGYLNGVYFLENKIWFCFRTGLIVQSDYDGNCSPGFFPIFEKYLARTNNSYSFYFHSYIYHADETSIILREDNDFFKFELTSQELASKQEYIFKVIDEILNNKLIIPVSDIEKIENIGVNVVNIGSIEKDDDLDNALDQMEQMLFNDPKDFVANNRLVFKIRDRQGRYLKEKNFFDKAVKLKRGPQKIYHIIERVMLHEDFEFWFHDDESTALAYAVHALVKHSDFYLNFYKEYFSKIDFEHDLYNNETIVPDIMEMYPDHPAVKEISGYLEDFYGDYDEDYDEEDDDY